MRYSVETATPLCGQCAGSAGRRVSGTVNISGFGGLEVCEIGTDISIVSAFQDTNHIQYELMNLFAAKNKRITVVGDPDQSIYGFRSAVFLEDNYRSSGAILGGAQEVIEQDVSRPAKKLQSTHCPGTLPVLRKLPTVASEAEWLVMEIKRCVAMTGRLINYSDCAILLRSASLSRQIESALGRAGVPYRMVGGFRFYDRLEIKLLLDYLRVVTHTGNSDALLRIINAPSRSIGEATVRQLASGAEAAQMPLWDFVKDVAQGHRSTERSLAKSTDRSLCAFVGLIEACRQKLLESENGRRTPRTLLEFIIKKLSFQDYLTVAYPLDETSRWANVEELLNLADDAAMSEEDADESLPDIKGLEQQQMHPGQEALDRFLANVALSTETSQNEEEVKERVTISTIHAAKGLEWPVVFVPAVYEGILPHSRSDDCDEERRLLYVAMTRAKASLYLSYPLRQSPRGQGNVAEETKPTSFLPPKLAKSRFRPTGPNFEEKVVHEMAKILDRPKPSAEDMLKGLETTPRVHDDKWSANGEIHPDLLEESGPTRTTYMASSGYTLGQTKGHFSAPPTTLSTGGFLTAREYIANHPNSLKPETTWDLKRKSDAVHNENSKRQMMANPPPQSQNNRPPLNLLGHRIRQPATNSGRPILTPSDPNKYAWLNHNGPSSSLPKGASGGDNSNRSDSRHTTTMQPLARGKKALGMRRGRVGKSA